MVPLMVFPDGNNHIRMELVRDAPACMIMLAVCADGQLRAKLYPLPRPRPIVTFGDVDPRLLKHGSSAVTLPPLAPVFDPNFRGWGWRPSQTIRKYRPDPQYTARLLNGEVGFVERLRRYHGRANRPRNAPEYSPVWKKVVLRNARKVAV